MTYLVKLLFHWAHYSVFHRGGGKHRDIWWNTTRLFILWLGTKKAIKMHCSQLWIFDPHGPIERRDVKTTPVPHRWLDPRFGDVRWRDERRDHVFRAGVTKRSLQWILGKWAGFLQVVKRESKDSPYSEEGESSTSTAQRHEWTWRGRERSDGLPGCQKCSYFSLVYAGLIPHTRIFNWK